MIHLNNLKLSFRDQLIFEDVSWHIKRQERIGLIGANGAGKTTLLRLLMREQLPDQGKINIAKDVTLGYLPQEPIEVKGKGLLDEVLSAVAALKSIEKEIEQLQHALADLLPDSVAYRQASQRLGTLQHQFEDLGGFQLEAQAKKILAGLGFSEHDYEKRVETFSGGWQMRIALAKLLLINPGLLLLDEPTNHLDIQTLEWLESYLQNYPGTIIIVSHDRFFLQRIVSKIVLLERGQLYEYVGSYVDYEKKRQLIEEKLWQQYEHQKEEIARIEHFIDRFRYKATKASQVQSRIKQLEKIKLIIPPSAQKKIHFYFPTATQSGRIVSELQGVSHAYNHKTVLENIDLKIERYEKIALVGVNGAGKSTLCRIITGIESPTSGTFQTGHNVKVSFYAQETADALRGDQSVLDEALTMAPYIELSRLRSLLGCFLFTGDAVYKPLSVLSGGEKSRLALAKMLLVESNLLILDEPTNHLDLESKEVLKNALKAYSSTMILVSHDRFFLDQIVERVVEVRQKKVRDFPGNYSYYLEKRELLEIADINNQIAPAITDPQTVALTGSKKNKEQKRQEASERQKKYELQVAQQTILKPVESQIEQFEARKIEIEHAMAQADFYSQPDRARMMLQEYKQITTELRELYEKWETLIQ
ncbi:ABC-F family ATP-binding cassette domain-containing protein [candidate division KSB1 bacterium]|nr:ABC-F family ATP-binding cassette domain-containing protein [candidate division KSB1 bacterium]